MAGKNSVRIPVALELESDDIVKDYKTTINKISNVNDLQSQFKELLKLQKQYIDNAKASTDPIMKALNLQGVKAYSEMLGRIQSQVEKIDKTKMSDFSLPKFQFDDKEIINNVKNIDRLVKSVVSDIESIGKSSSIKDLGSMFKGIGSDSIKNFYKERVELSAETVKSQLKNDKLSIESIEKLLDVMQQYEVFNKKILKKNGTISTNIADILPKDLLKNEKLFKNISLDDLQIRWNKITTPDIVDNVRSAIIGNLSSRAMNKPLYIPTDGLIMSSDVANDFGEYQKKIDAAKTSLKELGKEFMQLNENVDSTNLEFKTKEGKDDIEQMNKYLDMAFQIKSTIQDIKSMSSVIGIDSKDAIKLSDFGLTKFDDIYKNILGKSNSDLAMKYLDEISASISDIYNKTMGNIGDDSEQVLKSKLSQINKMITLTTNSSLINDTNLTDEFDEIIGKENSLNLVLSQRQKIMAELEKKGYKLSENEIQANSATLEAEQIRKGFMPKFGQNTNGGSGVGAGSSNVDESIINEIKIAIADLNKRVSILETDMPDNTKTAIEEIKSDITKIQKSLKEQMTAYIDSKALRDAHSYVNEINAVLNTLKSNDEITTMQNKFKELTSTVYGLTDALSKMYGEQFKINSLAGSPRYLTEENGNEKVWYRGVNGMMGNGLFSSGYNGAVFYTDNVEVASKAYAGSDGKGKIEKAKIIANKTWEIDGNKSSWREIEYLGNGEDELSERISLASARMEAQLKELSSIVNISKIFDISSFKPITSQFQDVAKIFDQLIANTNQTLKADQIEKIKQIKQVFEKNRDEYIKISNDDSNPYGIHDTDTYVKYAQSMKNPDGSNKYDSIVFKNIYDGVSKTSDQLSTVAVTLGEAQSQYIETLSAEGSKVEKISSTYASSLNENESKVFDQIRMLTDKVTELENKGVKANDGDIKAVTEDVAKLSEQLNNISKSISSDSTSNIKDQLQPLVDTVNKLGNLEGISSVKDKFKQLDDQIIAINQNLSLMESKINNIKPTSVLSIPTTPNNIVSEPFQNNNTNDNIINDNTTNDKLPEQIDYYKQLVEVVTRYNELEAKHIINGSKEEKYYDSRINRQEKLKELYKNINDLITQGNLLNDNRLNDITISDHNKSISVSDISNWNVDYDRKIKDLQTKQSNDIKTLLNNVNKYEQGLNEMVRDGQVSANNQKSLSEIIIALEMSLDIIKQNSSKDDNQKYEQKISGIIEKAKSITVKTTKPKSTKSSIKETTNTKSNYLQEQLGRKDKSDTESLEISKLQSQINALQKDRENQKKKNRELTKEISALKSVTDTTEVKSKQLAKQAELDKLRREMDSRDNEILFLQKQIDALKQNMTVNSDTTNSSNLSKRSQTSGDQSKLVTTSLSNVDPTKAEVITKALGTLSKALKDYETVNKSIELPKISSDAAQIDAIIPKMNELTKSLKEFKAAVTGIANSSVIGGLDNLIEKLTNLSTSGKINLQISNVKSVNEEIDKFSKMVIEWAEAIQIQKKAGANEVERVALFNSKNGFLSNSYVSDKNDEVRDAVNREMLKRYQKEKVDTHIHSHPENIAAFSFDDLNNHIKRLEYGITKNLVVASKEVMKIDLSGVTDKSEYTKFIANLQENVNKQLYEYMYNQLKNNSVEKIFNNSFMFKGSKSIADDAAIDNKININQSILKFIDNKINGYISEYRKNPNKSNLKISNFYDGLMTEFDKAINQNIANNPIDKSKINQLRNEVSNRIVRMMRAASDLISEDEYATAQKKFLLDGFRDSKYANVLSVMSIEDFKKNNPALSQITQSQENQSSDNTKLDEIIRELKNISQKMDASTTKASNNASPNISANQSPNNTPSSVTTPSISSEVQAASEAATAEVAAFTTIDNAVTSLTGDINTKTEAIRVEQQTMATAAESEVASVSQIKQAVSDLATQIHNVPKVRIVGENDGKLNISANLTEEQIAVIREKLKAAFSGEQAVPISFVPNVEGLKQQIADALKNVPVEITNNNINKVIKVNKFKANSDGVEALRNSISSQLKNVKIQSFDATTAAESVKETLSKVLDGVGLKFDTEKLGNEVREAVNSGVEAASAEQKPEASDNKAVRFKEKATNDIGKLRDKYTDKLQGQQLEVFKERLSEIDNKIKEIKDDASNYTDENAQVIDKDIKQIESLVNSFKEINNSEDKINSLIQKLKDSKNSIERRGAVAQPVVNNINSEMSALEELKRSGQNLNVGNPAEVQAFIDKLHEADATVESLQQSAKDIRVSTNTTASVAKLDSKFNDLLFKVDKFKRDNSKITSDKGISAQFDSLLRSIQTIEKSDVNFQRLRAQFDQLKATVQGKGLTGRSLGDELKYIAEKIGIKAMLGNSIYRVIGAFRQMVGIVTELDTGMTTLRRVTEETEATYRKFLKTAGDEAHELGSTVSGLVDSTGDFARLGYNIQEANALAKNAVMYSNVGWLDIQTATADMTSTMKAFNIEASDSIRIVDTFDILGKKLPLVTISVKGWRHSRPSKDIVNNNICVTTAGGVW